MAHGKFVLPTLLLALESVRGIPCPPTACKPNLVAQFSKYPGYSGNLTVSGAVRVGESFGLRSDENLTLTLKHDESMIGWGYNIASGEAISVTDDGWVTDVSNDGPAHMKGIKKGDRIAKVDNKTFSKDALLRAIDSGLDYQVTFEIEVEEQRLWWDLGGVDTACVLNAAYNVKNGCGIHLHTGTSCASADEVGGHYYNKTLLTEDPWSPIVYVAASDGSTEQPYPYVEVMTGLSHADIQGRVMVVHQLQSGARIACGVLTDPSILSGTVEVTTAVAIMMSLVALLWQ